MYRRGIPMPLKRRLVARRLRMVLPLIFFGSLCLYAVWPWVPLPSRAAQPRTVIFYGFSILGEVMHEAIFPAFQEEWQARTGEQVEIISAFSGSGTITNQIIMGVPAS